nr:hypothetical protein CFP56_37502 [Quercus suber]
MNTCTVIQLSSSIWLLVQYRSCNQNFGVCTCEIHKPVTKLTAAGSQLGLLFTHIHELSWLSIWYQS